MPGYHALLGMHAFGLEETGDYDAGRAHRADAVELEPRDSWAWHAVAHVHEMRNAPRDGIAWLSRMRAHVVERQLLGGAQLVAPRAVPPRARPARRGAARCTTQSIGGPGSAVVLDMIDCSAMLWRLHLRGVDVGDALAGAGRALGAASPRPATMPSTTCTR